MTYMQFFISNYGILSFGVLITLFSSFGQTFLISIFVPLLLESFALSTGQFSMVYSAATLSSAAFLPYFGRLIDRVPIRRFSIGVGLGLVMSCALMAGAVSTWMLFAAIVGLRLTGQGLLSLVASTTMARQFGESRGRALSVSSLGYPLGEGFLPLCTVLLVHNLGWRISWGVLAALIAVILLPLIFSLLPGKEEMTESISIGDPYNRDRKLFRDGRFYLLLPVSLYIPFTLTGLFLYQMPLAESFGWAPDLMASAFIGFAAARFVSSIAIGPWIDRWTSTHLFPVVVLPLGFGLLALSVSSAPWLAFAYLILAGVSQGMSGPMMTALWAEIYGTESLGEIKGSVSALGIFATALSPLLMGWLIEIGVGFQLLLKSSAVAAFVVVLFSMGVRRKLLAGGDGK